MLSRSVLLIVVLLFLACASAFASFPQVKATGNVIVLSHYGYFEPYLKIYWVLGEVKNVGDTPVINVVVNVSFWDASDVFINSTVTTILFVDPLTPPYSFVLLPGAKAPFNPVMFGQVMGSENVDHYTMNVTFVEWPDGKPVGLQMTNFICWTEPSDYVHVNCTITNTGTETENFIYVYGTGYDSSGAPIGWGLESDTDLDPGEAITFDVEIILCVITTPPKTIDTYTITAQSSHYAVESEYNGVVPEFPSVLLTLLLMTAITAILTFYKKRQI